MFCEIKNSKGVILIIEIIVGDIVDFHTKVDIIINAWNRNYIPHRMLLAHGVSKSIKKSSGLEPFDEVQSKGLLKLGEGVLTSPGKLKCKGIIHVAGINLFWQSSEKATRLSAKSIVNIVLENNFNSLAVPLIGCGGGKLDEEACINILMEEFKIISDKEIYIVKYKNF